MKLRSAFVLFLSGLLFAQTFPAEFKTSDTDVQSHLNTLWRKLSQAEEQDTRWDSELQQLTALNANPVYRQLNSAARVAALQRVLPLLKTIVLSAPARKAHEEWIARQFGAVNHGVAVSGGGDPMKRYAELGRMMEKNPKIMSDPKFMKEFEELGNKISGGDTAGGASGVPPASMQQDLTRYTKPLAELKREIGEMRQAFSGAERKCLDDALALADTKPDTFRLRSARCFFQNMGINATEAAIDKERKEQAQILYNRMNLQALVKRSLSEFVATAATVDFAAATTSKGTKVVFVNPAYEKKNALWKMIYRNGKAPSDAAVAFAKAWMAEL